MFNGIAWKHNTLTIKKFFYLTKKIRIQCFFFALGQYDNISIVTCFTKFTTKSRLHCSVSRGRISCVSIRFCIQMRLDKAEWVGKCEATCYCFQFYFILQTYSMEYNMRQLAGFKIDMQKRNKTSETSNMSLPTSSLST